MMRPRVKICCISSVFEAELAINYGASALGLVGNMPSGPGVIPDELILQIAKKIPPPVASFLLTSEMTPEKITGHYKKVFTNTIQLVDYVSLSTINQLKLNLPGVKIVQVIHVTGEESIEKAVEYSSEADAILLDSGNPDLMVKELGGTGRTHNWKLSKKIVEAVKIPVFLAGGLNTENVERAIEEVQPFGLDLCSGVRCTGKLNEQKLDNFMKLVEKYPG